MSLKQKLAEAAKKSAGAVGNKAFAAFNRADELGGELRDYVQERWDSDAFRRVTERLARVRGPKDTTEFDERVRAAQRAVIEEAANASPPPTAAELEAEAAKRTGLGDPDVAAQIFGRDSCAWTGRAITLLNDNKVDYDYIDLDDPDNALYESKLIPETKQNTVPWIYLRGEFVGGFNALDEVVRLGQLAHRTLPLDERAGSTVVIAARENRDEVAPGEATDA